MNKTKRQNLFLQEYWDFKRLFLIDIIEDIENLQNQPIL